MARPRTAPPPIFTALAIVGIPMTFASAAPPSAVVPTGEIARPGDLSAALRDLTVSDRNAAEAIATRKFNGHLTTIPTSRGAVAMYFDDFSSYPTSTDPIFDRFQVNMDGLFNPSGGAWDFSQSWYIPTLCIDGQLDDSEPPLPDLLPRWQGADLEESEGFGELEGDVTGDGSVDTADLGLLVGSFGATGAPGFSAADINMDGVVDTADLGILLGQFGQSAGPFCFYEVSLVHAVGPDGTPLDPTTIAAGPIVEHTIAIPNFAYSNDEDMDGCPDCGSFRIDPEGGLEGEQVYGEWALLGPEFGSAVTANFAAQATDVSCDGWGDEACLCDARGETAIIENTCCFFGARVRTPLIAATIDEPIIADLDVFMTDIYTFQWIDWVSSTQGANTGRVFLGGYGPSLTSDFLTFTTPQGFIDRPIFLGTDESGESGFFSTIPKPELGASGFQFKTGEWFTIRLVVKTNEVQIWFNDSETRSLTDPAPGDNGDSTPLDGSDDIEDGFAKIFPTGPFGPAIGTAVAPNPARIPQPLIAAASIDAVRFLWAGDPTQAFPDYEPHNACYDNILITGVPVVFPTPPIFELPYADDIEVYNTGGVLGFQGDRWFERGRNQAYIDDSLASSPSRAVREDSAFPDGGYLSEFGTALPIASANSAPWTLGVDVALSGYSTVRAIALNDNTFGIDPFDPTVARLLVGVENDNGIVVLDGAGHPTIHMRVRNPNFTAAIEPDDSAQPDAAPDIPPVNSHWINVPTDATWDDANTFHRFTFEVDAAQNLVVRRDGAIINPDPTLAPLAGYAAPGWTAGSVAVDELAFESGNQAGSLGESIWVDNVTLEGADPVIASGPPPTLPYSEGFEDYPANAPINGQADGRYTGSAFSPAIVLDDPTGSGRGHVLRGINADGFNTNGNAYYLDVTLPGSAVYATGSTDCVLEVDCYVTDYKSRYALDFNGPNGSVTTLQLGGPDIDYDFLNGTGSPGSLPVPETNFALLEVNPNAGGPFGMGPDNWYYDTGTQVPLNAWFRIRVTVHSDGPTDNRYTIEMDGSGAPGGDGVFEVVIDTGSGEETNGPSALAGETLFSHANAIDGLDTITGLDFGGDGVFHRDPIEITQDDFNLPGAFVFPDEFCFYRIEDIDGTTLGTPPPPCGGVFGLSDVIGVRRNAALPDWPNGGVVENCPTSLRFIWNDAALTGQCAGEWTWLDPDNPATAVDFPQNKFDDVESWAEYDVIPPYVDPGPASRWYFDNITLDGSPTP